MTVKNNLSVIFGSIFLMLLLFVGCHNKNNIKQGSLLQVKDSLDLKYARGFEVYYGNGFKKLIVKNPWQHAANISYQYFISTKPTHDSLFMDTPLKKVVCLSTTHIGFIDALNQIPTIKGIANPNFVSNAKLRRNLEKQDVQNVGNDQALNYEQVLNIKPDVVFAYSVGAEVTSMQQKLNDWGIPVVVVAEYLENSPLAKAEWIKFFGAFYNQEKLADSLFNEIEKKYNRLAAKTSTIKDAPKVMTSLPWKDVWYIPGGDSFMAHYIKDAGGDYLWKENKSRESQALAIEHVFQKGQQADVWVNVGLLNSLNEVKQADTRLSLLPVHNKGRIYNNNRRMSPGGGNDFYESGVVNPHLILRDLIHIFHPTVLNDTVFTYYKKLN